MAEAVTAKVVVWASYNVTAAIPTPLVKVTDDDPVAQAPFAGYAGEVLFGDFEGPLNVTHFACPDVPP
jgi:hypothetical protein